MLCMKNNDASSLKHPEFVEDAIKNLLSKGCIKEVKSQPYCCNPLTVADKKWKTTACIRS